jgi:hypothetical protein
MIHLFFIYSSVKTLLIKIYEDLDLANFKAAAEIAASYWNDPKFQELHGLTLLKVALCKHRCNFVDTF